MIECQDRENHKELIAHSWERCRQFGLQPSNSPRLHKPDRSTLQNLLDEHQVLIDTTNNEVLPYYDNILSNSQCLILLTDQQGQVLSNWGDQRFLDKQYKNHFQNGVNWLEQYNGTNAIGTALATGQAVQIKRDEHYLKANRFVTGSAAPVYNADRQLIGVLDVSSDTYLPQSHTLGMVKLMSQSVENRLIINKYSGQYFLLNFNTHPETIDSPWSGLLAFNDDGLIISANRRAERILGMPLLMNNISQIFNQPLPTLKHDSGTSPVALRAIGKYQMFAHIKIPVTRPSDVKKTSEIKKTVTEKDKNQDICIDRIEFGDQQVNRAIQQAQRIFEKDIPILIYGETGVGKEVFVKALHEQGSRNQSPKNQCPLVAVNCAAIPGELIESELFGYEKGAFTGANTKGAIGLIRKAHKGTLFLDEIGDMPLKAQARLLRVLQERRVTPLGSIESFPVDIKLVSATNQNLKNQVEEGLFRKDLYYRVNGLNLKLPPLRQRTDRLELFREIHGLYRCDNQPEHLSEEIIGLFMQHGWPGNIRQLVTVMQVALALSDNEPLSSWHLPEDFFDDLETNGDSEEDIPITEFHVPLEDNSETLRVFHQYKGNISQTAKSLGVSRNTLYKRLKVLGVR